MCILKLEVTIIVKKEILYKDDKFNSKITIGEIRKLWARGKRQIGRLLQ